MIGIGTSRRPSTGVKTIVRGDRVFSIRVRPLRRLDGSLSGRRSWEIAQRRPTSVYLGCGTAHSEAETEAAINAAIASYFNAPPRARRALINRAAP